jgi:LmbE family N-acetylglucosaminyl deacetylase
MNSSLMKTPFQPVLLAVFAHPDDESYRAGGLLAHLASKGVRVQVVTATRGEAGSRGDPPLCSMDELSSLREKELQCACGALGILPPIFLGLKDGHLAEYDKKIAAQRILVIMSEISPQVLLTYGPGGISGHPDHIAIGEIAREAFLCSQNVSAMYQMVIPKSIATELALNQLVATPDSQVTLAVNVSRVWVQKWDAIHCHCSQISSSPLLKKPEEQVRRFLGYEHFVRALVPDPKMDFLPALTKELIE